jgi:hypothetical protein
MVEQITGLPEGVLGFRIAGKAWVAEGGSA